MYPRLYCLGLIEAETKGGAIFDAIESIRGFIASASLKLVSNQRELNRRRGIRGFIASASLKPEAGVVQAGRPHCIRGFIASASLKRRAEGRDGLPPGPGIRGFIASASLKHCRSPVYASCDQHVSEALLPRPH